MLYTLGFVQLGMGYVIMDTAPGVSLMCFIGGFFCFGLLLLRNAGYFADEDSDE